MSVPRRAWLLLALLCLAAGARAAREGVFVGYKEVGVEGQEEGGDDTAAAAAGVDDATMEVKGEGEGKAEGGDNAAGEERVDPYGDEVQGQAEDGDAAGAAKEGAAGGADGGDAQAAAGGDDGAAGGKGADAADGGDTNTNSGSNGDAAEDLEAAKVLGRTVLLYTQYGAIKVRLLEKLAPQATALVWRHAQRHGCNKCAFYRNEARPRSGFGPPYALLQGRLDLPKVPPNEGNIQVKMGHVCFIPHTTDFFIAYGDHPEWGNAHTVWGQVDEWFTTDFIIQQQWNEIEHEKFGTKMRMLKVEVPIRMAVEGDTRYTAQLGPMHYPDEPPATDEGEEAGAGHDEQR